MAVSIHQWHIVSAFKYLLPSLRPLNLSLKPLPGPSLIEVFQRLFDLISRSSKHLKVILRIYFSNISTKQNATINQTYRISD